MEKQQTHARYIYAIVKSDEITPFKAKGIGDNNASVYTLSHKDLSAIVSATRFKEFDPVNEHLLAHESVLQEAVIEKKMDVAPMRFCTIVGSEADARRLLHEGYLPFKKNLLKVKGRIEVGVKIFADAPKMKESFGDKLMEKSREMGEYIHNGMKPLAILDCLNELTTDDMILNASFLIERGNEEQFMQKLVELDKEYTDFLHARLYGPNAAYNFVSMPKTNRDGTIRK